MAAAVSEVADELGGLREFVPIAEKVGGVQVDVGEVERHRAARGDLLGLVEDRASRRGIAADGKPGSSRVLFGVARMRTNRGF